MTTIDEIIKGNHLPNEDELLRRIEERITNIPLTIAERDLTQLFSLVSDDTVDQFMCLEKPDEVPIGNDLAHLTAWMQQTCDLDNPGDHWAMITFAKLLLKWGHDIDE